MYFDCIHLLSQTAPRSTPTFPTSCSLFLAQGVKYVMSNYSWVCSLPWSVVYLPEITLKQNWLSCPSPTSYQFSIVSQLGVGLGAHPSPLTHHTSMLESCLA